MKNYYLVLTVLLIVLSLLVSKFSNSKTSLNTQKIQKQRHELSQNIVDAIYQSDEEVGAEIKVTALEEETSEIRNNLDREITYQKNSSTNPIRIDDGYYAWLSPNKNVVLYSKINDPNLYFWNSISGEKGSYKTSLSKIETIEWSPTKKYLIVIDQGIFGSALLLDVRNLKEIKVLEKVFVNISWISDHEIVYLDASESKDGVYYHTGISKFDFRSGITQVLFSPSVMKSYGFCPTTLESAKVNFSISNDNLTFSECTLKNSDYFYSDSERTYFDTDWSMNLKTGLLKKLN